VLATRTMDVPVYALALVLFALLYLALSIFLVLALAIALLVILSYLALRYPRLPEDYPHGRADVAVTVTFIGITWAIFSLVGPKNPVPIIGSGLTYAAPSFPLSSVLLILVGTSIFFLATFAFVGPGSSGSESRGSASPPG
jgi:predicted PurR-regulated permease PerM